MSFALTLDNISCERDDRVLFSQLSARFSSGDLVQIVGPNGAGKTTLLKVITGISGRYTGDLTWSDTSSGISSEACSEHNAETNSDRSQNDHPIPSYDFNASMLYLGHMTGINSSLTPMENLQWYFGLHGAKSDGDVIVSLKDILRALAQVGLGGYEDFPCHQMSAGQQRRVALARLYISKAPLWVLDEPFTAIDKQGVQSLERCINAHRKTGGIVVLTTHQSMHESDPIMIDLADYQHDEAIDQGKGLG
ncbi:MAG: heme ABC exporter ATP-binding protein CcmA [Agarilytica sp.]